jgi:hypothetical protein
MLKFIKYISTFLICVSIGLGYLFSDNLSFDDNIKYMEEKLKYSKQKKQLESQIEIINKKLMDLDKQYKISGKMKNENQYEKNNNSKLKNIFGKNYLMKGETSSDFWELSALADGTLELSMSNGYSDYGKWWIEGNTWCRKFNEARNSVTSCYTIQHVENNKYLIEKTKGNGVDKTTVTID